MRDRSGKIIYVGKSRKLKARVSQYFQNSRKNTKTQKMVDSVYDFDYILCSTEIEALSLENTLIKQHTPRYKAQGRQILSLYKNYRRGIPAPPRNKDKKRRQSQILRSLFGHGNGIRRAEYDRESPRTSHLQTHLSARFREGTPLYLLSDGALLRAMHRGCLKRRICLAHPRRRRDPSRKYGAGQARA